MTDSIRIDPLLLRFGTSLAGARLLVTVAGGSLLKHATPHHSAYLNMLLPLCQLCTEHYQLRQSPVTNGLA